jgi:hypothetical protein
VFHTGIKQNPHRRRLLKDRINELRELNARNSQEFLNQSLDRQLYRAKHPTEIAALKCMDGRLHLPVITETPLGIIQPFRNLGGKFNAGWPFFQGALEEWRSHATNKGRHCLIFVTYHFSRGDAHRGCRGFNYDTDAARQEAERLKNQIDQVYRGHAVKTIVCGIETDYDALILHGDNGEVVDMFEAKDTSSATLSDMVKRLYPDMATEIQRDIRPLLEGNARHIQKIRESNRAASEIEHKEWILGIGRGFDWLHLINAAFIVGPYSPDLSGPIETAARLLLDNVQSGRVKAEDGIVILTSALYRKATGPDREFAVQKAKFLSDFAQHILEKPDFSELTPHLQILSGVVNMNTRKFEQI